MNQEHEQKFHFILRNHDGSKVTRKKMIVLFAIAAIFVLIFGTIIYRFIAANGH